MRAIFVFAVAGLLAQGAVAATPLTRDRGTLLAVDAQAVTLRMAAGGTARFLLTPQTRYVAASRGSLADVRVGRFIGTATKARNGREIALEVSVFPEAMRGVGEGHYPWDTITDTTVAAPAATGSSMTNGSVGAALPAATTASSMTNGNIGAAAAQGGGETLTVTYAGGTQTIIVPAGAPVVTLAPAAASVLRPGESVLVFSRVVAGKPVAVAVSAGINGTRLPM